MTYVCPDLRALLNFLTTLSMQANLIYLAKITDRVPIIPPFVPSHIGGDAGSIAFGDIFNTTRLGEAIGIPVIEWKDVKRPGSEVLDDLGCWDIWQATQYEEAFPRWSGMLEQLNLGKSYSSSLIIGCSSASTKDVSYTRAPDWVKLIPGEINDKHTTFWALAALAFKQTGDEAREGRTPRPSEHHRAELPPDDHLMCFDYLYYVCAQRVSKPLHLTGATAVLINILQPFEYGLDFSPAWRFAAQYMRWTDRLDQIADLYVRRTLGTAEGQATPHVSNSIIYIQSSPTIKLILSHSTSLYMLDVLISRTGVVMYRSKSASPLYPSSRVVSERCKRRFRPARG